MRSDVGERRGDERGGSVTSELLERQVRACVIQVVMRVPDVRQLPAPPI